MTELFHLLEELGLAAAPHLAAGLAVLLRVGAAVFLFPGIGSAGFSMRIRLTFALAVTAAVAPAVFPDGLLPESIGYATLLTEPVIGLLLGAGIRLFVWALQTAGAIIGQSVSLAQLFGNAGEQHPAMANVLTLAATAVFMAADLHLRAIEYLVQSYSAFPSGALPAGAAVADWGVVQVGRSFTLAFTFAAPFVLGALIYNIALGVINRALPQLMVAFVGAPALTLGGLVLFALSTPLILPVWLQAVAAYLLDPLALP